ncbi:hypothetical protein KAW80_03110 [Candidatus Babeliales bacterium]|nr:hypothetical protein [Candidatus Babeliales bacterium]
MGKLKMLLLVAALFTSGVLALESPDDSTRILPRETRVTIFLDWLVKRNPTLLEKMSRSELEERVSEIFDDRETQEKLDAIGIMLRDSLKATKRKGFFSEISLLLREALVLSPIVVLGYKGGEIHPQLERMFWGAEALIFGLELIRILKDND